MPTAIPARTPNRSAAAKPQRLTEEALTAPAATEAMAPGIPVEDTAPATPDRTRAGRTLPVQVRIAAALRIRRVAAVADGLPVPALEAPAAAQAPRVQAAQAVARTVNLSAR